MWCVKQYKKSKYHHLNKKGAQLYNVNKKAGVMVYSGLLATGIKEYMTILEAPLVSVKTDREK